MRLSIIIPAYNEERRIGPTLVSAGEYLQRQDPGGEIIVVNNNSSDGTAELVRKYQETIPRLRIVNESRPGKGYAVARGMAAATGDIRLFTDADNATAIEHFDRMKPLFAEGCDVVIGSLAAPGASVVHGEPFYRVLFGKLGNLWIQLLAVPGIWDTQRGFKAFTAKASHDIFPRLTIFGWGFDVEVLAIARIRGYAIKEIPITWNNDPESKVTIGAYPQVLLQTIRIFFNKLRGIYGRK